MRMEAPLLSVFEAFAEYVASGAELISTVLIALGVVDAASRIALWLFKQPSSIRQLKNVWLRLAGWILLSLEFALAADIVRSSISPSWEDIGQLAAIATIRTVLSFFLERDLSAFEGEEATSAARTA
jgi:uncharacterized membrane protein